MRIVRHRGIVLAALLLGLPHAAARADERGTPRDGRTVAGAEHFPGDAAARERLARDGFVVLPRFHKQIFSPYIGGALPYYVTCDSAHRTYHVLFEEMLKGFETANAHRLEVAVRRLDAALADGVPETPRLRAEGHPTARVLVAVASRLLGLEPKNPDAVLAEYAAAEAALVEGAEKRVPSPTSGDLEDYAFYRPRGLYAGDPTLERYFRATTWLQRRGLRVMSERETLGALLIARAVAQDAELGAALGAVTEGLDWLVGPPDDLTVAEYLEAIGTVTGGDLSDAALEGRFTEIGKALAALRAPEINAQLLEPDAWRAFRQGTKGLRLLPARFTPDAWLFQRLGEQVPGRSLPSGLEVAQALGSKRAGTHLAARGAAGQRTAAAVAGFAPTLAPRLAGTHYGDTLRTLSLLFDESGPALGGGPRKGILRSPVFSRPGWHDRLLATGLCGWTSLRHAWALQAKTTVHYMGITDDPAGAVEPAPRFFRGLADLTRALLVEGDVRGAFRSPDLRARVEAVVALLGDVRTRYEAKKYPTQGQMVELEQYSPFLERMTEGGPELGFPKFFVHIEARLRAWLEDPSKLTAPEREAIHALATSAARGYLEALLPVLERLQAIAEKEVCGEALDEEDAEFVRAYGKTIAGLQFFGGNAWLEPRRQMGLVVDVASDPQRDTRLQVAVGAAMELYVVLPGDDGKPQLHQGGVYAYYEFGESKPLTDDEWRARVTENRTPPLPGWMDGFLARPGLDGIVARIDQGEIVTEIEHLRDERIAAALLAQLKAGTQATGKADEHLAWVAGHLVRYGDGPQHQALVDALLARLLAASSEVPRPGGKSRRSQFVREGARALGAVLDAKDYARVVGLLASGKPLADEATSGRLVQVLVAARSDAVVTLAEPLFSHTDAAVRRQGVKLLDESFRYRERGPVRAVAARLVEMLASEKDADVQAAILDLLDALEEHVDRGAIRTAAPLLESGREPVRAGAARLLGTLRARKHAARLLQMVNEEEDERALAAAATGLGGALFRADASEPPVKEAVETLFKQVYKDIWRVQVACLEALGMIGGELATSHLGTVALDGRLSAGVRSQAIGNLGAAGEASVPYLFELLFDEAKTGDSVNDHDTRLCDDAAEALDRLLGGRFGWDESSGGLDMGEVLEAMRAQARKQGHAPEGR